MELAFFLIILTALCIFDIRAMIKANKKKELFSYICLTVLTLIVSMIFLINPYRDSISYLAIKLFRIEG